MKCDSPPAPRAEERAGGGIDIGAVLSAAELGITMSPARRGTLLGLEI